MKELPTPLIQKLKNISISGGLSDNDRYSSQQQINILAAQQDNEVILTSNFIPTQQTDMNALNTSNFSERESRQPRAGAVPAQQRSETSELQRDEYSQNFGSHKSTSEKNMLQSDHILVSSDSPSLPPTVDVSLPAHLKHRSNS